ncbi:hypothetical protein [Mongoliimonas terrestris]|uniref:hypothetical protein n=1 Tax=Mongoliimonas terrestris TaxID=1709001 RepID=UPI001115267D|nr:hypothetical protein [Mongoliimonas terrestris]
MNNDERYVREKLVERYIRLKDASTEAQVGWGRWLVGSLILVHGGALVALSQGERVTTAMMKDGGICFAVGIVLALASGFAAWMNFTFSIDLADDWSDPRLVTDATREFSIKGHNVKLITTLWASALCGVGSVASFAIGGYRVYSLISP